MKQLIWLLPFILMHWGCRAKVSDAAPQSSSAYKLDIESVHEVGIVVSNQNSIKARDVGASGKIGGSLLWTFGDTIFTGGSDQIPRSATAAWVSDLSNPLQVTDITVNGAPEQFIPYTQEELNYNATNEEKKRIALWPNRPLPVSGDLGIVYFGKILVGQGFLNYSNMGVGIAYIREGQSKADRPKVEMLFGPNEPHFVGNMIHNGYVYAYGTRTLDGGTLAARVPVNAALNRVSYTFWNGSNWVPEVSKAVPMVGGKHLPPASFWNRYAQRFLSIELDIYNSFKIRHSESPTGPWSDPISFRNPYPAGVGVWNYAAYDHPDLAQREGRDLFITHYHPMGAFKGDIRMIKVVLNASVN